MPRRRAAPALLAAVALVTAGCGNESAAGEARIAGDTVTIYVSAPLGGPGGQEGRAVVRGAKLALLAAGGRAGRFAVTLDVVDPTGRRTGRPDAARVAAGARDALRDPQGVAYVGDLDPRATAISAPVLNSAGVLQVVPAGGGAPRAPAGQLAPSGAGTLLALGPPAPAARREVSARFRAVFGAEPTAASVAGFAAMQAVLAAVSAAGDRATLRSAVAAQALAARADG